jgi:hypothetical protein
MIISAKDSQSAEEWSSESFYLASVFATATLVDWGQTRDIVLKRKSAINRLNEINNYLVEQVCGFHVHKSFVSDPMFAKPFFEGCEIISITPTHKFQGELHYEKNNIYLGKRPSLGKVDTYMPIILISTLTIAIGLRINL